MSSLVVIIMAAAIGFLIVTKGFTQLKRFNAANFMTMALIMVGVIVIWFF